MSDPSFSEWVVKEVKKRLLQYLKLLTFEAEPEYGNGPDFFGGSMTWVMSAMFLVVSQVFLIIRGRDWLRFWLRVSLPLCIIVPIGLALRAKYRYEVKAE